MDTHLMLGNEAVARGAYEAGVQIAAAYPGTPSTEIVTNLARYDGVYAEWSTNEKVAYEVAFGAAMGGARALTAMKSAGGSVAADPLISSVYTGINGGLVVCLAGDPGMASGMTEQDDRYFGRISSMPMLEPADSQECYEYAKRAFAMSEEFDVPVMVRLSIQTAHQKSIVRFDGDDGAGDGRPAPGVAAGAGAPAAGPQDREVLPAAQVLAAAAPQPPRARGAAVRIRRGERGRPAIWRASNLPPARCRCRAVALRGSASSPPERRTSAPERRCPAPPSSSSA